MADHMLEITDQTFEPLVMKAATPVMVDFWAPWCAPCKALTPTVDKLAKEFGGRIAIGKMDIQAHPRTAGMLGIRSIPTLLFFKGGKVVDSLVGVTTEDKIRERLQSALG